MSDEKNRFVYVTYIRTTPEKLWEALTRQDFNQRYWFGYRQEAEWAPGSPWKLVSADGTVADAGQVLEVEPYHRLVLKWRNEIRAEARADGFTRCTFAIEPENDLVKLTVTHEADGPHKLIGMVSQGWPMVLSSLKSLLETGNGLSRSDLRSAA